MGSSSYFSLLIIFIFLKHLDITPARSEENEARKYIADEDTRVFLTKLKRLDKEYGRSWMVFPDGNGTAQYAKLQLDKELHRTDVEPRWIIDDMPSLVTFHLYTRENIRGEVIAPNNVAQSGFNPSHPTKIICHGWRADDKSTVITSIRDAYLKKKKVNVITVDWNPIASDPIYTQPAYTTRMVGRYVADLINSLVDEQNAKFDDFHFIGHSLGAHIGGFTGSSAREKIGRITGLDPALPCFQDRKNEERLDPTDATFVDVIHTCSGILGMSIRVGHVDFYPNGGTPFQPGCCWYLPEACSHSRSHEFFAESITRSEFRAVACPDWNHFKKHMCSDTYSNMGENVPLDTRGTFYLKTQIAPPFSMGMKGTIY